MGASCLNNRDVAAARPHPRLTRRGVAIALAATLAACGGGSERDEGGIEPTFEPAEDSRDDATAPTIGEPSTTAAGGAPTTIIIGGTDAVADPPPADEPTTSAAITDPEGDATPSPVDPAPAYSDLLGAQLTRSRSGYELRIRLAGGDAPEGSGSADHTMNLASFYDVDGDGEIDFEIWANLADGGWDGSYFDNRDASGRLGADSFVEVTTERDEVVLRFALLHLDRAERFRWSVAGEWGRYEALGTPAMVRDEAPDEDGAAQFPA